MKHIIFFGWFILYSIILFLLFGCRNQIRFTDDELRYISSHSVIIASEENYPPFMYLENGKSVGISYDVLMLISEKSGLKFTSSEVCYIAECIDNLRLQSVHVVPSLRPTPQTSAFMSYTRPYFLVDMVIMKRVNLPQHIGVLVGTATNMYISQVYPELAVTEYRDVDSMAIALLDGQIDAIIINAESAKVLRQKYSIKYDQSIIPFDYPISFGLRKEDKMLKSIFDRTIASFTADEVKEIKEKWE